jgi:hypothetical protein
VGWLAGDLCAVVHTHIQHGLWHGHQSQVVCYLLPQGAMLAPYDSLTACHLPGTSNCTLHL